MNLAPKGNQFLLVVVLLLEGSVDIALDYLRIKE